MADPVVRSDADVARILPPEYLEEDVAPVRDALVHAHAAQQIEYQERSDYAAQQSDIGRAVGRALTGLAQDRTFRRQDNEGDDDFRARVLAVPDSVSPTAIAAAVNAILASVGAGECQILESVADRLYANDVGGTYAYAGLIGATPISPMRLYPEDFDSVSRPYMRPNSSPGGGWSFSDEIGRYFIIRVPDLAPLDTSIPTPWRSSSTAPNRALGRGSMFLRAAGGPANQNFLYGSIATAIDVYQRIADTVSALVGHSIRWKMISDSRL